MAELLHTNHDGSRLMRSTVHRLIEYPVWRGQRIIDLEHAKRLRDSIDDIRNLDTDYHLIVKRELHADGRIIETRELVGGQHRRSILLEEKACLRLPDFQVTYTEKDVESETEAEAYFNKVSSSKPMHFDEDPGLVVGRFIVALEKAFVTPKKVDMCIRQSLTRRPYLYIEDVRPIFVANIDRLRRTKPIEFANRVKEWNRKKVEEFKITRSHALGDDKMDRCIERNFALAYSAGLPWILACLP